MPIDVQALTATAAADCSPTTEEVTAAVEAASGEVNTALGCSWEPQTGTVEELRCNGERLLQLSAGCVTAITGIELNTDYRLRQSPPEEWLEVVRWHYDGFDGIEHPDHCGVWSRGWILRVTFDHGLMGEKSDVAGRIVAKVAARKISQCPTSRGVKSQTMGSFSQSFFEALADTTGDVTAGELRMLQRLT